MCGIVALISLKEQVIEHLLNGLKQLQNRGYDSAGICTLNESLNILKFASTDSEDSIKKLNINKDNIKESNIGIAHTRWATHGGKTDINSHPHLSYDNKKLLKCAT